MPRNPLTSRPRVFTGLLSALLFSSWAIPFAAQVAPEIRAEPGFAGCDATHETTRVGTIQVRTIQDVIIEHVVGSPAGLHLLVACRQGVVDTHFGRFLCQQAKAVLYTGTSVKIVGAAIQLEDKGYFQARELSVGSRNIAIRNRRGSLIDPHADGGMKAKATAQADREGGGR
jgi:hypothetical protein